jgi:hypothetical protein
MVEVKVSRTGEAFNGEEAFGAVHASPAIRAFLRKK